jgi:predicted phage terminase large subunit-like protein
VRLADLPYHERQVALMGFTDHELHKIKWDWEFWARDNQLEPPGDWSVWLLLAGRGFGKTRSGAEWVRSQMCGPTPLSAGRVRHMALVAETAADARDIMVEQSASGILSRHPADMRPTYIKSLRRLEWPNGAIAHTYSAEDPEQLRGPEHDAAWSDELAKWKYADETWDMLQFGLRVGDNPRQLVTTTPRPIQIVRDLLAGEQTGETVVTRGNTYDNVANLSPKFIDKMRRRYEGTRLGRQELHAEVLDDVQGALWTRAMLERRTERSPTAAGMSLEEQYRLPDMRRVVVGVDPSGTSGEQSATARRKSDKEDEVNNDIGIVCVGLGMDDQIYVLEDATVNWGPADWAKRVVDTYKRQRADMIVGEVNFGGAMVEFTIRTVDRRVPFRAVHASRGKVIRAQPVAALYEQGRVRHVGTFAKLEDQMINMTQDGYAGRGSPDRVDALVWAIYDLEFGRSSRGGAVPVGGSH